MKSLATITGQDIETIKMALNDAISDMNAELKGNLTEKQRAGILEYKNKYARVFGKLRQNSSIYALSEVELDLTAGGLNDAIQLLEENLTDDLSEEEKDEVMHYKNDCTRLVELLAG
tara:strand:- start:202 stop:552 length:351 start_codon:yes stop_codon:yes gene_type:complete